VTGSIANQQRRARRKGLELRDEFVEPRARGDKPISLRWIFQHMIEEYARHNGHADLLRECIDGSTGD
jgi:hypothetical protein